MKTIKDTVKNEIIIKNSRFIAVIANINDENDAKKMIDSSRDEYKKATHYCYGYIINDIKRFDDDGEPGGTAGMPILNVLEKNRLNNIICIVIRYFGGIKLGAGGLVRAYGKATREALKESTLIDIINGYQVKLSFSYDNLKNVDLLVEKVQVTSKEFKEEINYTIFIEEKDYDIIDKLKLLNVSIIDVKKDYLN